jgi:hypothetical protein
VRGWAGSCLSSAKDVMVFGQLFDAGRVTGHDAQQCCCDRDLRLQESVYVEVACVVAVKCG